MRIIFQKSNNLNTYDFFSESMKKDSVTAVTFNITYTKDKEIVVFNTSSVGDAVTNTINNSTFNALQGYEIFLLDELLNELTKNKFNKEIYINLVYSNPSILSDDNIKEITLGLNNYVDELKKIVSKYPILKMAFHSSSRNLVTILKDKMTNEKIGIVISGDDLTFIDVSYYIILASDLSDIIVDTLLKNNKEVNIYISTEYYISYVYQHYLGEKSTPELQEKFKKLGIVTIYPEIISKVFNTV